MFLTKQHILTGTPLAMEQGSLSEASIKTATV
jgi:hypothetical protein